MKVNLTALAFAIVMAASAGNAALARDYFVSKKGTNADGLTWQSAWNEMNQIKWNQLLPGDRVVLDGGAFGGSMIYTSPMNIQATGSGLQFVIVSASNEPDRSGDVIINGQNKANSFGVVVQNSKNLVFQSQSRRGWLKIRNCSNGLYTRGSYQNYFQGLDIANCKVGAHLEGDSVTLNASDIHDNDRNVEIVNAYASTGTQSPSGLSSCWVYNKTNIPTNAPFSAGVVVSGNASIGGPSNALGNAWVTDSVIGPNVYRGVQNSVAGFQVRGSLFLNPIDSCLQLDNDTTVDRCTLFVTPKNILAQTHNTLNIRSGKNTIKNTIVYQGVVKSPLGISYGPANTQFGTLGNTTALSASMVDPQFVSPVGTYTADVSFAKLRNSSFKLKAGSPAAGTGAVVTSVDQVLARPF